MLQLLLVRSVRKDTLALLNQSDPGNCDSWFSRRQCCTVKCDGKQPYQLRTLLGAELHNCRIQKGPYKRAGKWLQTSETMDSLFLSDLRTPFRFPKSDYMCHEICDAHWPPTNTRPHSLWQMNVDVYRSGGVEREENACASMVRVNPQRSPPPKSEQNQQAKKKSNGFFSKIFKRFKSKGKGK
eukprot:Skav230504  [mRNA]  locus=scaffold2083:159568:160116:+ [translate_table: standard]